MPKKKIKDKEVCESCGKPKMDEAMTHFKAVQEAMKYIRIKDNKITYAGVIWMIGGWTLGRIIGIILIDRLDRRNGK